MGLGSYLLTIAAAALAAAPRLCAAQDCAAAVLLSGTAGRSAAYDPQPAFAPLNEGPQTCPGPYGIVATGGASDAVALWELSFGPSPPPPNAVLFVSTCGGGGIPGGAIFVGRGCPRGGWDVFACERAAGDGGGDDAACTGRASLTLDLGPTPAAAYFVYATVSGDGTPFSLSWELRVPPPGATPSPSASPPPACAGAAPLLVTATLSGLSGTWENDTSVASSDWPLPGAPGSFECSAGPSISTNGVARHMLALDSGVAAPPAGGLLLSINTCSPNPRVGGGWITDTGLYVGDGCPVSAAGWGCDFYADESVTEGCPQWATSFTVPIAGNRAWVLVTGRAGEGLRVGKYGFTWLWTTPSPSPSPAAASALPTPSGTPSPSRAASASPTTPATPSQTPSASGNFLCQEPNIVLTDQLEGPSGLWESELIAPGNPAVGGGGSALNPPPAGWGGPNGTCVDPPNLDPVAFNPAGSGLALRLSLGLASAGLALGGELTIDTCTERTSFDTMLFVGDSCPTGAGRFACFVSNDDAVASAAPPGAPPCRDHQSRVNIRGLSSETLYLVVSGNRVSDLGPLGVRWSYAPPPPSGTPQPTPSASSTLSPGAPASATPSQTRSPSGSPRPPSVTPSNTSTPPATPLGTPSPGGACGGGTGGAYLSARLRGAAGVWAGTLRGEETLFPNGVCGRFTIIADVPQVLVSIDTGGAAAGGGAVVRVDTCAGSDFDPVLWAGAGCPAVGDPFSALGCVESSNDAPECGPGDFASLLMPLPANGARVYVLITPRFQSGIGGGAFNLSWRVLPSSPPPEATPSATPTTSARPPRGGPGVGDVAWLNGSLAVLAMGNAQWPASPRSPGVALPLSLLEMRLLPGLVEVSRRIPVRTAAEGGGGPWDMAPCSLAVGTARDGSWAYDLEGLPSLAADGTRLTFPCYAAGAGSRLSTDDDKVVADADFEGSIDTSTVMFGWDGTLDVNDPHSIRTAVVTADSAGVYVAGVGGGDLFHGCVGGVHARGCLWWW